jgi:hypothetical protein
VSGCKTLRSRLVSRLRPVRHTKPTEWERIGN